MSERDRYPHSAEAEKALLGSLLLDEESAAFVFDVIGPNDFHSQRHRTIYRMMLALRGEQRPIELVGLRECLDARGELAKAGGSAYIAGLTDGVPLGSKVFVEEYCRVVKNRSLERAIISEIQNLSANALEGWVDPVELLGRAIESMSKLAAEGAMVRQDGKTYKEAAMNLMKRLENGPRAQVMTGIEGLDKLTGGFQAGELVIFTAETGVGKTLLAQQTRLHACTSGLHTLFASAEMDAEHLLSRDLPTAAGVRRFKLRQPEKLKHEDLGALLEAAAHQCERCRVLDGAVSIARIRRTARQMRNSRGLDLIIIDYDELVEAPGETELDQQRNVAVGAKRLAVEFRIPVIVISQLRKLLKGEDRRQPSLQRLYGSGAKPKHASIVIYVDREFVRDLRGDETKARVCVLKNRDGLIGAIEARFNVSDLRFEDEAVQST